MISVLALVILTLFSPASGFFAVVFGTVVGDRTFSYWHASVGGLPLFITEAFLAAFVVASIRKSQRRSWFSGDRIELVGWMVLYAMLAQSVVRGLMGHAPADVFRDAALVYYSAFYFVANRFASPSSRRVLAVVFGTAILVKIVLCTLQLQSIAPWDAQPAAMSLYFAIFILAAWVFSERLEKLFWPLAIMSGLAGSLLVLYQVRTAWLGFAAAGLLSAVLLGRGLGRRHAGFAAIAVLVTAGTIVVQSRGGSQRVQESKNEFMSMFAAADLPSQLLEEAVVGAGIAAPTPLPLHKIPQPAPGETPKPPPPPPKPLPTPVPNASPTAIETNPSLSTVRTRLWMWGDLVEELARDGTWVFGVPCGKLWLPPRIVTWWDMNRNKRVDPHNSILAIAYRVGLGVLAFFVVLGAVLFRGVRAACRLPRDSEERLWVIALIGATVYCFLHALTDVTLENPFKGIFLWISMGLLSAVVAWQDSRVFGYSAPND